MGWKYQGIEYITIPIETHYTDYPSHLQETNDYKLLVEMCKNNDLVYLDILPHLKEGGFLDTNVDTQ